MNETYKIELPKETIVSLLVVAKNYQKRIEYLERENKISDYKLNRIKNTTLYDINNAINVFEKTINEE